MQKLNFHQRITSVIYIICLLIFSIWFIPYRITRIQNEIKVISIEYDSIFANLDSIDLYRSAIIIILTTLVFLSVLAIQNNIPDPDLKSEEYKRVIKRELIVLSIFILALVATNIFCLNSNNNFEERRNKIISLETEIDSIYYEYRDVIYKENEQDYLYNTLSKKIKVEDGGQPKIFFTYLYSKRNDTNFNNYFNSVNNSYYNLQNINTAIFTEGDADRVLNYENIKREKELEIAKLKVLQSENPFIKFDALKFTLLKAGLVLFCILYLSRFILYPVIKLFSNKER